MKGFKIILIIGITTMWLNLIRSYKLNDIMMLACDGYISNTLEILQNNSSGNNPMESYLIGIFQMITESSLNTSTRLFLEAKSQMAVSTLTTQPLLNRQECGGLTDLFYITAVSLNEYSKLDLLSSASSLIYKQEEIFTTLITLTYDSGLMDETRSHINNLLHLYKYPTSAQIRNSLLSSAIYNDMDSIYETRNNQMNSLVHLWKYRHKYKPLKSLNEFILSPTFYLIYQGYNDKYFLTQLHRIYSYMYPLLSHTQLPLPPENNLMTDSGEQLELNRTSITKKIKIGFVSNYFRKHSVCKLFCELILQMDTNMYDITVFSTVSSSDEDDYTQKFKLHQYIEYIKLPMLSILNRDIVYTRHIDILFYLDVGMTPSTIVWASSRLAPIQICTWGHPSTTGLLSIDYYLSSRYYHPSYPMDPSIHYLSSSSTTTTTTTTLFHQIMRNDTVSLKKKEALLHYYLSYTTMSEYELYLSIYQKYYNKSHLNITDTVTNIYCNKDNNNINTTNTRIRLYQDHYYYYSEQLVLLDTLGFYFKRPYLSFYSSWMKNKDNNTNFLLNKKMMSVQEVCQENVKKSDDIKHTMKSVNNNNNNNNSNNSNVHVDEWYIWLLTYRPLDSYIPLLLYTLTNTTKSTSNTTVNTDQVDIRIAMNNIMKNKTNIHTILQNRTLSSLYKSTLSPPSSIQYMSLTELLYYKWSHPHIKLILCPQHLPKFHPLFDTILVQILSVLPHARLILVHEIDKKIIWKNKLEKRWKSTLGNTVMSQIIWLSNLKSHEYLVLQAIGDLLLDPYPFGGGVTSLEALAVCTPIVTLPDYQTVPALTTGMIQYVIDHSSVDRRQYHPSKTTQDSTVLEDTCEDDRLQSKSHDNDDIYMRPPQREKSLLLSQLIVHTPKEYIDTVIYLLNTTDDRNHSSYFDDNMIKNRDKNIHIYTHSFTQSSSARHHSHIISDNPLQHLRQELCQYVNILYESQDTLQEWNNLFRTLYQ